MGKCGFFFDNLSKLLANYSQITRKFHSYFASRWSLEEVNMAVTINLYLDNRAFGKKDENNTEYPVKITITKNSQTAYLATGIKLHQDNWKNRKVVGRKDKARLNDYLDNFKTRVRNIVLDGEERYRSMTATEIKKDIERELGKNCIIDQSRMFLRIFSEFAENRKSERTKQIYLVTARKIRQIYPKADMISIDQVDLDWLEAFNERLIVRGNNGSTRNIDFRNVRAVIRDAYKHKLIADNPFVNFEMPAGESPDRFLTVEQMRSLINADVEPHEKKYLDFFVLSFLLCGINTCDLLYSNKLENGRLRYVRQKTGKKMDVKVEQEAQEIFARYPGKDHLLSFGDTYAQAKFWTAKVDAALKVICAKNGLPLISMYWARHTWATIAYADIGIDESIIAQALGHSKQSAVTSIYIRRDNLDKVDEANRRVIDYVFQHNRE